MNVFHREMKAHRWGLFWWSLGMLAMIAMGMGKYAALNTAGDTVQKMMSDLPKGVQVIFGVSGFDLSTASGFFGMLFLYVAVMGAVHASLLGAHLISKEERDRTSEFLYSKPATRARILTAKLIAGLVNLIVLNLVTLASSFYYVGQFGKGEDFGGDIVLLMAGLFLLQVTFFSIGAAMAGFTHRPKAAPSMSTSIMFFAFLVSYMAGMNENLDFLKYFTPFKYYDAATLMNADRLDPVYLALTAAIVFVAVFGTYRFFGARDLNV